MKQMARPAKPLAPPSPRTFRLTPEALQALEEMRLAWKAHKWQVLDQAVLRLRREWKEGKVRGEFLITDHSSSGGEE